MLYAKQISLARYRSLQTTKRRMARAMSAQKFLIFCSVPFHSVRCFFSLRHTSVIILG